MRNRLLVFSITLLTFLHLSVSTIQAEDAITLQLPESVIVKATTALMPLNIDAHSKSIDGDITIINISDLQLTKDHLACRLHLAGNNLALVTEIAGHEIRLKVGSVEVDFLMDGTISFDPEKQILYIQPVIKNVTTSNDAAGGDIGQTLVALLNGRKFPISLQKLDPLIAEAGAKTVTIDTKITSIEVKENLLELQLSPEIKTK